MVMLMTHSKFRNFTPKAVCDTGKASEVLLTPTCESRADVDGLVAKAVAALSIRTAIRGADLHRLDAAVELIVDATIASDRHLKITTTISPRAKPRTILRST
jgi:hypothetical protein